MEVVQILPSKLQKLWNAVELRLLVILSLFIQMVLIAIGNRRKYRKNKWAAGVLWMSYLSADSIATLALGVLSQAQGDTKHMVDPSYTIMAFWAPFLLIHLGGPDTITAYALADNELWKRHALGLVGQVLVAIYVISRSWTNTSLNHLWWVIFFAGVLKYGERTWVLYSASKEQFRESVVSRPDPGPNYAKFMDEFVSREDEGYKVSLKSIVHTLSYSAQNYEKDATEDDVLQRAHHFFRTFRKLFADLILSFQDKEDSRSFFTDVQWDKAFRIVEVELGLVYDLFYTKFSIVCSPAGIFLRLLTCSSTIAVFINFLIIDKDIYPKTEVIITYVLLSGAIFLEIYAFLIVLSSDWVMIWLTGDWTTMPALARKFRDLMVLFIRRVLPWLQKLHIVPARRQWSNKMGQYNILSCCVKGKRKFARFREYLECLFGKHSNVPDGLKALIFNELKERPKDELRPSRVKEQILLQELMSYYKNDEQYQEVEFDQSVLLWHMATDFCDNTDVDEKQKPDENNKSSFEDNDLKLKRESCKLLSNYMMHLLIKSPFMLPSGIGQIRFQDTCAEASEFFNKKKVDKRYACVKLGRVDTRLAPSKVKGDRSKSLLFDARRLANSLESPEFRNRKWDIITEAWLDILTFAAAQCRWTDHAEKLSEGGELLSHVWLLMAHFGMTDQFQISEGYIRAKLQLA